MKFPIALMLGTTAIVANTYASPLMNGPEAENDPHNVELDMWKSIFKAGGKLKEKLIETGADGGSDEHGPLLNSDGSQRLIERNNNNMLEVDTVKTPTYATLIRDELESKDSHTGPVATELTPRPVKTDHYRRRSSLHDLRPGLGYWRNAVGLSKKAKSKGKKSEQDREVSQSSEAAAED